MEYNCHIVSNNNTDFVIANDIKSGNIPCLIGGHHSSVSNMNFDLDECCRNNNLFRVKLKKAQANLKTAPSLTEKFKIIQDFIEDNMPICEPKNINKRMACVFDGEPFSYIVEHKMCMCSERAALAQYLCQESGIKSYMVNSYVHIKDGEQGQHAYIIFEDNNQMFVYDPANPTKNNAPRIMSADMDKSIFADFAAAVNHNADSTDDKQKNNVGFVCQHEDGKMFLYRSHCGNKENHVGPKKLKEARLTKYMETQNMMSKIDNTKH